MNRISLKMKRDTKVNRYSRISSVVIFVYVLFVLWGQYALSDSIFPPLFFVLVGFAIAFFVAKKYDFWIDNIKFCYSDEVYDGRKFRNKFMFYFSVSMLVLTVYFIARYPGIHCLDTVEQLQQIADGEYEDWHPVIHTLLVMAIPMKLFGIPGIVYVQVIFFSLALAYMMAVFYKYAMKKTMRIIIYCLIMLNPMTGYMMMIPWKDSTFAILTMLLTVNMVEIVYSKGKKIDSWGNIIGIGVIIAICTLIRHNAVLFTLPMILCMFLVSGKYKKKALYIIGVALMVVLLVKGVFYKILYVEKPNQRVVETTGMCMVMMGNAYVSNKEGMSEDAVWLLENTRDPIYWEMNYKIGDWNFVKWSDDKDNLVFIDTVGTKKIIEYTVDTIARCPEPTIQAFLSATGMIWQIDGKTPWDTCVEKYDNNYHGSNGKEYPVVKELDKYETSSLGDYVADIIYEYKELVNNSILKYLFYYIGIFDLLLILFSAYIMSAHGDIKGLVIALPCLVYNFGTAILLSGYDWRFFYYTFLCFFGMMFAMQNYKIRGMEVG